MVVLNTLPPDLLAGLPEEDQAAIRSIIGLPVTLAGQAELEFFDGAGDNDSIWVEPSLLRAAQLTGADAKTITIFFRAGCALVAFAT